MVSSAVNQAQFMDIDFANSSKNTIAFYMEQAIGWQQNNLASIVWPAESFVAHQNLIDCFQSSIQIVHIRWYLATVHLLEKLADFFGEVKTVFE